MEENIYHISEDQLQRYRQRGYKNEDILPKPVEDRHMTARNYFTLWMGSVHNIPNYAAVVGFLMLGLSPINVMVAITLAGLAVAVFMIFNGRAGAKFGIPFAMHLRSTYGSKGAKLPGFLRGVVAAIAWFGVQTYTGAAALTILISKLWPAYLEIGGGGEVLGITIPELISFVIFWIANMAIGFGGGGILNKFTAVLSPIIYLVFGGMTIWAINVGGGIGNILQYNMAGDVSINPILAYLMIIASVLSVWAAPGVSVSDFTQNARSQKDQAQGQVASLLVGYLIFAFMAVVIIIGGTIHFGAPTSGNGVLDFINQWDSLPAIIVATLVFLMTTISTNATGNIIPAAYQLAALFPKQIDYRKGVLIAGIISFLIMPWNFMSDGGGILVFLNAIGSLLGPVAGVMIAHYYFVNKQEIDLDQLYFDTSGKESRQNIYTGVNKQAYVATVIGLVLSMVGQFIPALSVLSDMAWITGFISAFIIYYLLIRFSSKASTIGIENE
ncbi:putative allantoin permease [Aerococcus viridans]|uniref:allantoin permease n=1 Tax=Aerococcus viridans TaxID=1377 RepID=UPI002DBB4D22|nr:putative allantoin permease [Aerococcus viridans]MEB7388233.1 putative allantoin permease [Aerococcus viridans]